MKKFAIAIFLMALASLSTIVQADELAGYNKGVYLFDDAGYKGINGYFTDSIPYVGDRLNDKTSSLIVPPGYTLKVYKDSNYQGDSRTFNSSTDWVGEDFNDKISSIEVHFNDTIKKSKERDYYQGNLLREGDIIFGYGKGSSSSSGSSSGTGHVGIIVREAGNLVVREAHPKNTKIGITEDGVQNKNIAQFCDERGYTTVWFFRVYTDDEMARKASNKTKSLTGKYLLFNNWWDGKGWYCSQLAYWSYLYSEANINLDTSFLKDKSPYYGRTGWSECHYISPCDIAKSNQMYMLLKLKDDGGINCYFHHRGC